MSRVFFLLCMVLLLSSCGSAPEKSAKIEDIDPEFAKTVLQSEIPVLVDFWAPWCAPCRIVAPALDELAQENAGKFKLVKVNIDEKEAVAEFYGIETIPALILFKNGATHRRLNQFYQGDMKAQVSGWLKRAMAE